MERKKLFQRLWSEEDEIVILKGISNYTAQKGFEPPTNMIDFHEFIKTSIHVDVSTQQLRDKVRKMKTKYQTNAIREKKGGDLNFANPHEQKAFELARKVWGRESESPSKEERPENVKDKGKMPADRSPGPSGSLNGLINFTGVVVQLGNTLKQGRDLIEESKKVELDEQWKRLHEAELELLARRKDLHNASLIWDAYESLSK